MSFWSACLYHAVPDVIVNILQKHKEICWTSEHAAK